MHTHLRQQRYWGLLALVVFFLIACSCPNPLNRGGAIPEENPNLAGAELGDLVIASGIGPNAQPLNLRNEFSTNDPIVYAVAEVARVEQGTTIFARWFRNGEGYEDSPQLIADRTYTDTFVEFHLEPESGRTLEPGDYTVQLYINGNPGPRADFTIR